MTGETKQFFYSFYIIKDSVKVGFQHGIVACRPGELHATIEREVTAHDRYTKGATFHLVALNNIG